MVQFKEPLEAASRLALSYLAHLDSAPVAPTAGLDELRRRLAKPLSDSGTPCGTGDHGASRGCGRRHHGFRRRTVFRLGDGRVVTRGAGGRLADLRLGSERGIVRRGTRCRHRGRSRRGVAQGDLWSSGNGRALRWSPAARWRTLRVWQPPVMPFSRSADGMLNSADCLARRRYDCYRAVSGTAPLSAPFAFWDSASNR